MSKKRTKRRVNRTAPVDEQEAQDRARAKRLIATGARRRPADVAFIRHFSSRQHPDLDPPGLSQLEIEQSIINDRMIMTMARMPDTKLFFGTERFCDVVEATDAPPVVDLTALLNIGNHTMVIGFERNIKTDNPGLDLCAAIIGMGKFRSRDADDDEEGPVIRIFGHLMHEDQTVSTFVARVYDVEGGSGVLGWVDWNIGRNWRKEDTTDEHRIVSNILGLLAQAGKLFTDTEFRHYTKGEKTEAMHHGRKLPPVNVIGLRPSTDRELTEHHAALAIERDYCWPVRGYFRQQPYGPGHKLRRLTYIAPHVKGNLDGPLISRAQVHKVG